MNILLLTHEFPPFKGGIGTYCKEIALAAAQKHKVTVFAPSYQQNLTAQDIQNYPFEVIRFQGDAFQARHHIFSLLWKTYLLLSSRKFDIVHAADMPFVWTMRLLHHLGFKIPFIATVHGTDILLGTQAYRLSKILRCRDMYDKAHYICANSDFTKKLILKTRPAIAEEKIRVTYLGVHPSWFENIAPSETIKQQRHIPSTHKIIITVARLDPRKGHDLVIEAIKKLPDHIKEKLTYLIVGKGSETHESYLKKLAENSGAQIIFAGAVSNGELKNIYACADIFCMPGKPLHDRVEGFGLVYLEAAAQKIPSLATEVDAIPEVVKNGETGIIVPSNNIQKLSEAMESLLTDPQKIKTLGENAFQWAKKFTWEKCADLTYKY